MKWLCDQIGCAPFDYPYRTIASIDEGFAAVAVLERVSEDGAYIHVAARNAHAMTPKFLAQVFYDAFVYLNLPRITGLVPVSNKAALKFDRHLGFVTEGLMRKACNGEDLVILGMLKEECRFISGAKEGNHGQA